MKRPKISEREVEEELSKTTSNEEIILRRLNYRPFKELVKFVIICLVKYDFITSGQIRKRFGVSTRWALDKLNELMKLGLLKNENITGSNVVQFLPVRDKKGDPVIYKYYTECKKRE